MKGRDIPVFFFSISSTVENRRQKTIKDKTRQLIQVQATCESDHETSERNPTLSNGSFKL